MRDDLFADLLDDAQIVLGDILPSKRTVLRTNGRVSRDNCSGSSADSSVFAGARAPCPRSGGGVELL